MNTELITKIIDDVIEHPHYLREDPNLNKKQLHSMIVAAWVRGLLNVVIDKETKEFVALFEAHTIDGENLWKVADKCPILINQICTVLFIDMAHINPEYRLSTTDMFRILYKTGKINGAMKLHWNNRKKSYLYTLDKRKYEDIDKFFVFNKNINFMV